MILLDPDMNPDPAPATVTRLGVPTPPASNRNTRLPSARTLGRFLAAAQGAVRLRGQVTVLLTSDVGIRRLNRRFRGKNKATDVLSFAADGVGAEEIAGDVAISVQTALRQAIEQGHSLSTEIKVLMLHGLLHLAGYDHEADNGRMARREGRLRAELGLPQGLIERTGDGRRVPDRGRESGKESERHPSGAKARAVLKSRMYGLKPVPFKEPMPVPFNKLKPVPFAGLKPVPFTGRVASAASKVRSPAAKDARP
jgi:probable rRNA maturation factor